MLRSLGPAWHAYTDDAPQVADDLRRFLTRSPLDDGEVARRAVWMLDRLTPVDAQEPLFEELWTRTRSPLAALAWGRRLRGADRDRLFGVRPSSARAPIGSGFTWAAAEAAWCASCPESDVASLLEWYPRCAAHGWPTGGHHALLPFTEYCRRAGPTERLPRLMAVVEEANAHPASAPPWPLSGLRARALEQLVRDVAPAMPPPAATLPTEPARVFAWLDAALRGVGRDALAEACRDARGAGGGSEVLRAASILWIHRHDAGAWDGLLRDWPWAAASDLVAHFGAIAPPDRLDPWEPILTPPEPLGNPPIVAFCGWLPAALRDALWPHVLDGDPDWAACAFQAYLHRAPESVLRGLFDDPRARRSLPSWQLVLLDRFLHAPPPLRPGPVCHDVQDVEADPRLADPLNHRAF